MVIKNQFTLSLNQYLEKIDFVQVYNVLKSKVTSQAFTVISSNNSKTLNPVSSLPGYSPIVVYHF